MLKRTLSLALMSIVITIGAVAGFAQEKKAKEVKVGGFRGEVIASLKDSAGKYLALAKVMPDEKMTWRPSDKVRSNTEVWMHVASANFQILKGIGAEVPADLPKDMDKITDRQQILKYVELSFRTAAKHVASLNEEDLNKEVDFFGGKRSTMSVIFLIANHASNHLGQSIAYARMNDVKPPWAR